VRDPICNETYASFKLQYVKGHQDKTTPYLFLNLMGQLNVNADEQAGGYNLEHGEYRPFALMLPST
jgi:hypothetical protein